MRKIKELQDKNIAYVAVDLDGTLLNGASRLSKKTCEVLYKVQEKGITLILCSGRSFNAMRPLAKKLRMHEYGGYLICFNGGAIYEVNGEGIHNLHLTSHVQLTKEKANTIQHILASYKGQIVRYSDQQIAFPQSSRFQHIYQHIYSRIVKLELAVHPIEQPIKMVLRSKAAYIQAIFPEASQKLMEVDDSLNVFTSTKNIIEVTARDATKGIGLHRLFTFLNISKEKLLVFGDQANDITMFKYANYSVAMKNAIKELKELSYDETLSNIEDGVAIYLEQLFYVSKK